MHETLPIVLLFVVAGLTAVSVLTVFLLWQRDQRDRQRYALLPPSRLVAVSRIIRVAITTALAVTVGLIGRRELEHIADPDSSPTAKAAD